MSDANYNTLLREALKAQPERNLEIYKKRIAGARVKDLAQEYSVNPSRIVRICSNVERNALKTRGAK